MHEPASCLRALCLEHAHQHVEDVVAEEAAGVARGLRRDAVGVQRRDELVDRQRRRAGDRAAGLDLGAGARRLVVVRRRRFVEIVGVPLDGDAGPAVRLPEAHDHVGIRGPNRPAELVRRAGVGDRKERGLDLAAERFEDLLRRIDRAPVEGLEARHEHARHGFSSSRPTAARAPARCGYSTTRATWPSRIVTIAA